MLLALAANYNNQASLLNICTNMDASLEALRF
jgi:hypothetical protein